MASFKALLGEQVLLPIIQADTAAQGVAIAGAMQQAGIHLVEVVLRTEASIAAMQAIKAAYPNMVVGAGTVTNAEILKVAIAAGADFIITPAVSPNLLSQLCDCPVPVVPGVSNSADVLLAIEHGFTELKLFPATLSGGAAFIKAMGAVFPQVSFCPTGGISDKNKDEFLTLPNCLAVGGSWVAPSDWVESASWDKITAACAQANQALAG
ncbi:bifunctional 4-hydroxy-2-oxoglutarate aldolase/2-dehydro-3-deoxy-phosphogluconate aldolase [Shewanella avicenniae]|uniref:Bifunctional 4-hydroxy-2-oxoglutarate aldolase/2-dehydro-3-deoxy-phosphogluconate aldolase n=1 Tax=Shewanella avicenniae TaxID=2814294 RepID=A0ABX7QL01_9GAMM|nr:bifunctional 4-hydroxy-2-oxoglutarate aldolase/2-dehydro-3-deoxy-phosphogluconate aldolase [Shewanella avicenniae]QSX32131.1 bifunctional 4-hydroxy-2-oxoglutarate aldolase/2-dehydro-3-deoxy-phosphogluconate aldolase [Shewanella avicenniae]